MSTPSATRRKPTDRARKSGTVRSTYAQHVEAVEETLRSEYTDGTLPVTLTSTSAADRSDARLRAGGTALTGLLLGAGVASMAAAALHGQVNAWSWVGLVLVALACLAGIVVTSPTLLNRLVTAGSATHVHTLVATSIAALREAPEVLREAEAPAGVIDAAVSLHGRSEARLDAIVNSEDPTEVDTASVRALVKDAARSLALVAIHDQRPDIALKAAVEALSLAPKRR